MTAKRNLKPAKKATRQRVARTGIPRVRRLDSLGKVRAELSVLYRLARAGVLSWSDFAKAAYGLRVAGDLIAASELEDRVRRLEGNIEPNNGVSRHASVTDPGQLATAR